MTRRISPTAMLASVLSAVLPTLLLNGCGSVLTSEQPARQDYLLRPYLATVPADGRVKPELALRVAVIPGLDTDRILALGVDARLNNYANARWPDHLPELLASVMQRSLESSGRFASVQVAATGAADPWTLDVELREFYGIQNAAGLTSSVRVGLAGRLACGGQVHAFSVEESARVAEERLAVVVAAHQAALDSVTRQLIDRMQTLCDAVESPDT